MQFDVVNVEELIGTEVFAFEIGVDRHLQLAASTDRRNEVDGHDPALLAEQFHGFGGDIKVHRFAEGYAPGGLAADSRAWKFA